ncbi:HSP20-like chaperone [Lasiosphaeria miniovina]|uniref:HSP20-like chaperone n=1 Tax=Lasiosphaeria miniovina TaxID=1954250 RepID=A0AA39ZZH9_9PEZI|nr:HSP20-like chaperone [Lasiosphaeria miniovina]KAK0706440.1 HSP20-like chaperone [Lasiosphaeria miniovina]
MAATVTPEVLWAQRSSKDDAEKNFIYLTISVPDVPASNLKLDLKPTGLTFSGHSDTLKRSYSLELEFYAEIDPAASKVNHTARDVEIKLRKKELSEAYWPRLLKGTQRSHFLKTDFDKWVDEDEQHEVAEEDFSNFGGMGGMPGMGGMGGMGGGDLGGIDFSKLGGGAGMPTGDEEDDEDSDDDMPALEGEEEEAGEKPAGEKKAEA